MTQKTIVSVVCMFFMLSTCVCFAKEGEAKKPSKRVKQVITCPTCGTVPGGECRLGNCIACKKSPGKVRHIRNCQVLRHKCGSEVSRKTVHVESVPDADKSSTALPDDFAINYETVTAGVIPSVTSYMRINKNKDGKFFFSQGNKTWDGKNHKTTVVYTYELTDAVCQKIYKRAQELGFSKLNDHYSAEDGMAGGISKKITLTAKGKSKTVSTYEVSQESFDKLVMAIEKHALINVLKSMKKSK